MLYFTHLDRVSFHQWFPTSDGAGNFPHPSKPQPVVSTLLCAIGRAGFVSWQLPEAHASPSLRKCCWPLPWRIGISPITNTHKTDRAPCRTVFKVPILKDKTHFFFFFWEAQSAALSFSQNSPPFSVMSDIFSSCPFTLSFNTSLLDRGSPSLSGKNNPRAGLCLSSSMVKRNAQK